MSKKHKIDVRQPERAFLTDTIPYELPIFFTNENLAILAHAKRVSGAEHPLHDRLLLVEAQDPPPATKPLTYEIARVSARPRTLSIPHPKSQHLMVRFYRKYETFILNSCNRTSFSMRHPSRVATHYLEPRYVRPNSAEVANAADEDPAGFRDQSRWASTYFSYRDYNLIYKFFDSDEFMVLETRYPLMMALDISRCFESIYTHSIEWSMRGKDFSKDHLPAPRHEKVTYESTFDATIRSANENETHGIIVGPESSRIFAEVILQSVDRLIATKMKDVSPNLVIKRYVDDFFIFGNTEAELLLAKEIIRRQLEGVNLHLNDAKSTITRRPFSSKTGAARLKASSAIDRFFCSSLIAAGATDGRSSSRRIDSLRTGLLKEMRSISVELEVPYERFASIALSVLDRKLIEYHSSVQQVAGEKTAKLLAQQAWLIACIRIGQFFFEIDCRVNTSIKIASIYSSAISLADILSCSRAPLENQILDGLRNEALGISAQAADEVTRINHICSVDALLTDRRRLVDSDLISYVGAHGSPQDMLNLSPFGLIALLYLSRRRRRFQHVREAVKDEIGKRVRACGTRLPAATDATLLLNDFISCPHLDPEEKIPLVRHAFQAISGQTCSQAEARAIITKSSWISFTDWHGQSDIRRMLARRELTPPYESG